MPYEESIVVEDTGSYIPSTNLWDVSSIYDLDVQSEQFKELFVRLYQNINNISVNQNLKVTGYYQQTEFVCGKQYFPNPSLTELNSNPEPVYRQVYRKVFNFGALPNTAIKTMPHGIPLATSNSVYTFTSISGCSTDPVGKAAFPLPSNDIALFVDATDIYVITTSDLTAYSVTYIVLEYLKQ